MKEVKEKSKKWLRKTASLGIVGIFVFLFFIWNAEAAKAINTQITFQGKLTNASGNTVSDGTYYLKFTIYDAATGGTCQYTASSTCSSVTSTAVTATNGLFSINLGDTSASLAAISNTLFNNSALYLGITVCSGPGSGCDSEMTPRKRLTATPYAFNADYLGGVTTSTSGGNFSYIPATDSSGNLKISGSFYSATTTAGQIGFGTSTVPSGTKTFIESTTASDKLLVIRSNASQSGNLTEWQTSTGKPLSYLNSTGDLYLGGGTATSTFTSSTLAIGTTSGFNLGKFYLDSSGNTSASGTFQVFGTSTLRDFTNVIGKVGNPTHKGSLLNGSGSIPYLRTPYSIFVSGDYAYVPSFLDDALEIIDISNPANPVHKGSIVNGAGGALLNGAYSVFVSGNYAYVASYVSSALEIIDISNPASPVHKGSISNGAGGAALNGPKSVFVSGNYAYVVSYDGDTLEIIDISNPANPAHKGSLANGSGGAALNGPTSVFVSGNYAYVASYDGDTLEIVDISNPASPKHKASLSDGGGVSPYLDAPQSVFVSGNNAYVASFNSAALEIVDISNPASPVHKGSLANDSGGAVLNGPTSVFVSGNYAYVSAELSNALEVVDVSSSTVPNHQGSLAHGTGGSLLSGPQAVFVSGNYAYVVSYTSNALEIIDISGAQISNARIGSLLVDTLQTRNLAQFNQGLLVHDGLSVGGNTQLFGDVSIGGGAATTSMAIASSSLSVWGNLNIGVASSTEKNKFQLFISASSTTAKPLAVRGFSGQTNNLTEWYDSTNKLLSYFDNNAELFISAGGTATSTLTSSTLKLMMGSGYNLGRFYIDSSGNVSASGSLYTYGNVTSTGILYATTGLISSASSTFSNDLYLAGNLDIGAEGSGMSQLYINASSTTAVPLIIRGQTGGSNTSYDYLTKWQDSSGNDVLTIATSTQNVTVPTNEAMSFANTSWLSIGVNSRMGILDILGSGAIFLRNESGVIKGQVTNDSFDMAYDVGGADNATTTYASNYLRLFAKTGFNQGKFYIDSSSGNVSASGSLYTFGNVTSTGILYATTGLISSASSTFTSNLQITGNVRASSTLLVGTAAGTNLWVNGTATTVSTTLNVVTSGSASTTVMQGDSLILGQGTNYNKGMFYVDANGNVSASGSLYAFGNYAGHLYPSTDNLYDVGASSTQWRYGNFQGGLLVANGSTTSTLLNNALTLGETSGYNLGKFYLDSSGNVSASGSLRVFANVTSTGHIYPASNNAVDLGAYGYAWRDAYVSSTLNVSGTSTFHDYTNVLGKVGNPTHKGSLSDGTGGALLNRPFSVFVSGNYAYIASNESDALEIIDISNPSSPVHKGSLASSTVGALLDSPYSVFVSGNYAYVASAISDALEIVDISNPASPVHKGSLSNGTGGALLDSPYSVFVSGNYAYVASGLSNALEIVDISNPASPVHKGSLSNGTGGALLDTPYSVFVSGNYAYVASRFSEALEIVDISNPASPVHKGSLSDGTGGALLNDPYSVFVSGNYAYVASYSSDALEIVDISNPASPVHKGSLSDGTGGALLNGPMSVFVSGNYAYLASFSSGALEIVDVSNPASPVHKGSLSNGTGGALLNGPVSVFVSGNYAYVASDNSDALEIVDVSGAQISNARIGSLLVDTLQTSNFAQFDQGLLVRDGLSIGGDTQLFGDVSIGGGRATTTAVAGGSLTITTNQTTTTLTSNVFNVAGATGFAFNMGTSTISSSTDRMIAVFQNAGTNKVLISAGGNVYAKNSFIANSTDYGIGDVAEYVNIVPGESVEAGDVVIADLSGINKYKKSSESYAKNVAGVVSDTGAFVIGAGGENRAALALAGLVRVKVTDENGPILVGDYLVSASQPGYAMKYDASQGKPAGLVGMALEPWNPPVGGGEGLARRATAEGKILLMINKGYVDGASQTVTNLTVNQNANGQLVQSGDLNMAGYSILNVKSINQVSNKWMIDEDGYLVMKINTVQGEKRLYSLSSGQGKEIIFSGSSQLENGLKKIEFELIDREIIDHEAPIKVSVTLTSEANGVFVMEKSYQGFTVKELGSGMSNATFDWVVIVKRKMNTNVDTNLEMNNTNVGPGNTETLIETPSTEETPAEQSTAEQPLAPVTEPASSEPAPVVEPPLVESVPAETPPAETPPAPAPETPPAE